MTRGRPFGVTGKYKDDLGIPIGVFEWRKLHPESRKEREDELNRFVNQISNIFNLTEQEAKKFIINSVKNSLKANLNKPQA